MANHYTPYQYAVAIVCIVATGALVAHSDLDGSVFASLVTLCLGYVFGRTAANGANGGAAK